jgi:hypothetical protein
VTASSNKNKSNNVNYKTLRLFQVVCASFILRQCQRRICCPYAAHCTDAVFLKFVSLFFKFRIICGTPHITSTICPHNSCFFLSLSFWYMLCVPNQALLFITATLLFLSLFITLLPTSNQTRTCSSKTPLYMAPSQQQY